MASKKLKFLFVLAHPETHGASFNHALLQQAITWCNNNGHEHKVSDLYHIGAFTSAFIGPGDFKSLSEPSFFKPQAEQPKDSYIDAIKEEQKKVDWCDHMIWIFPLYWFSVPAILKSWVERVFGFGWGYGYGHMYNTGKFKGKTAMCVVTTGGPAPGYTPRGSNGDLEAILYHVTHGIFFFCGFTALHTTTFFGVTSAQPAERTRMLSTLDQRLQLLADGKYPAIAYHGTEVYGAVMKDGQSPDVAAAVSRTAFP